MEDDPRAGDAPTRPPEYPSRSDMIGACRLVSKLGEGGMGEVWLAEQQHPVRRKVALKIIKLGMDTREVVARFATEQQVLALMDHASIARMFDAGATPEGRPYFVMEYVPGVPITDYCDTGRLTVHERLGLFLQVCRAVQHAHHKAIIHRDLKPSNVLVTDTESIPAVKIIDFGIAKAMFAPLVDRTMLTQFGGLVGTPEYMSPEQLDAGTVDVDTRSDIYALGVILYELLTGGHPIETASASSLDELRERIRTTEPVRPSVRVMNLGEKAEHVARARRTEVNALRRTLSGDLDWIVLKALHKDRNRRYGSPNELATDLHRHLTNEPVLARPPSAQYRMSRFVQRHRFGVAVSCAGALLLVAFSAAMTVLATRLAGERDRVVQEADSRQRIASFLQELFMMPTPELARGRTLTARDVLQRGVERIRELPKDQPAISADLLSTVGTAFYNLGAYDDAERLFREEMIAAAAIGLQSRHMLRAMTELGLVLQAQGRYEESAAVLGEARNAALATVGMQDALTLRVTDKLGLTYTHQGRLDDAVQLGEQAVAGIRGVRGPDHPDTLMAMTNLAMAYSRQQRYADALRVDQDILASSRRSLGVDHPLTLRSMNNLAVVYQKLGRLDEARALVRETITSGERVWGADHPLLGVTIHSLGEIEFADGAFASAVEHFGRALGIYQQQKSHQFLPQLLYQLGQAHARTGEKAAAIERLHEALAAGYKPQIEPTDDPHFASLRLEPGFPR